MDKKYQDLSLKTHDLAPVLVLLELLVKSVNSQELIAVKKIRHVVSEKKLLSS